MFVEEIVGPDGVGRVEIRHVDNNGMYEEGRVGEAVDVEKAIIQSYLHHVTESGFSSTRIHVGGQKRKLFLESPSSLVPSSTANVQSCMQMLDEARRAGNVHSFLQERGEGAGDIVRVQLMQTAIQRGVLQERDPDMPCPVAHSPQEWLLVQDQHAYKFSDLQFAKFSSMMLVYHMIKGWKKEFNVPVRQVESSSSPPMRSARCCTKSETPSTEASPAIGLGGPSADPEGPRGMSPLGMHGGHRNIDSTQSRAGYWKEPAAELKSVDVKMVNTDGDRGDVHRDVQAMMHLQAQASAAYPELINQSHYTQPVTCQPTGLQQSQRNCSFDSLDRAHVSDRRAASTSFLTSTGNEDNFWSDTTLFADEEPQPSAEESFWDGFFSSLD